MMRRARLDGFPFFKEHMMKRCLLMFGMAVLAIAIVIGCDKSDEPVGPGNGGDAGPGDGGRIPSRPNSPRPPA